MMSGLTSLLAALRGAVRARAALHLEVLALRHQLQSAATVPTATAASCERGPVALGVVITGVERVANGTRHRAPETVIAWHRQGTSGGGTRRPVA
jgi:hypothetical protein